MFILFGNRRINLSLVKEYKPTEKISFQNKKSYMIEFTYLDGKKDEIHFFEKEEERNIYLKKLDENVRV